jgi:hypothetical protein
MDGVNNQRVDFLIQNAIRRCSELNAHISTTVHLVTALQNAASI